MALTVGELNAVLSIDDRAVDPALRRAENALRDSGERMGDDAEQAGEEAGERLAEGLRRNAAGRLINARGQFVAIGRRIGDAVGDGAREAGEEAGEELADGLEDGAAEGADGAVTEATNRLEQLKTAGIAVGLAAGAAIATALVNGMGDYLDQSRIVGRLGAQLGETPAEAQRYGKIAGQLYADAVTEDFQGAADAIKAAMNAGLLPSAATNAQVKSMSTRLSDLAQVLEMDVVEAANAAGIMVRNGLAKNGAEAIDMLIQASNQGANRFGDLGETITQSANNLSHFGLTGKQALGVMIQGLENGAPSAEVFAGALEEMAANAGDGAELFEELGFNGKKMARDLAGGGPAASKALDQLMDKLRTMKDPTERSAAMVELFGEEAVAMQEALLAVDPSEATNLLGDFAGAADKAGETLRDNAGTRVEQFKRGIQQGLVNFLGIEVIPALDAVKNKLGTLWDDAGKGGAEGVDRVVAFVDLLGQRLAVKLIGLAPKAIYAISQFGQQVADWIVANPEQALKISLIAGAIAVAFAMLPVLVAGAIISAGTLMVAGFVNRLVTATREKLPLWWAAFVGWVNEKAAQAGTVFSVLGAAISMWFSGLWNRYIAGPVERQYASFLGSVRALPNRAVAALGRLGTNLSAAASLHWQRFKDGAAQKGNEFIAWVRGLPGRIASNLGGLGSLLTPHGRQVVEGLWAGIQSMGGWITSKLTSWAKSAIPGPIAKALGIASPSKVTKAQGKWIARGLVEGLTGSRAQVRAASLKLVAIVRDSLSGKKPSNALKRINEDAGSLDFLAGWDAKIAKRLEGARKKLDDLRTSRDQLAASVRDSIVGSANITQGVGPMNAEGILARLQRDRKAAELFAKNLAKLRKQGVRADLIKQIAEAGVDGGAATAAALASATPEQVKQINAQQKSLVQAAGRAGAVAGDAMYGAGIRAAQGLVRGLTDHQKYIEKTMLRIAKGMSAAIRKALGIKSPSRVMARIGAFIPKGLVRGIDSGRRAVDRSMSSLVSTPTPRQLELSAARGGAGGPSRLSTTNNTYNLTMREMTLQQFDALQRRQDALARVGRLR
ncbi:phage tail tape measure protein [Streptomyces sp. NPDC050211]|uniref:phage tail tape measure protein n=1 Tax=Streptomyces sp. NPDC050211 TaxID=3154932 RepID=UPI003424F6FA